MICFEPVLQKFYFIPKINNFYNFKWDTLLHANFIIIELQTALKFVIIFC